jgi:hypothetical protein
MHVALIDKKYQHIQKIVKLYSEYSKFKNALFAISNHSTQRINVHGIKYNILPTQQEQRSAQNHVVGHMYNRIFLLNLFM